MGRQRCGRQASRRCLLSKQSRRQSVPGAHEVMGSRLYSAPSRTGTDPIQPRAADRLPQQQTTRGRHQRLAGRINNHTRNRATLHLRSAFPLAEPGPSTSPSFSSRTGTSVHYRPGVAHKHETPRLTNAAVGGLKPPHRRATPKGQQSFISCTAPPSEARLSHSLQRS